MKNVRNILAATAVAGVIAAVGATPASAQVPSTPPPCTPGLPAIQAVDCTFLVAEWAVAEARKLPNTAIDEVEAAVDIAVGVVQDAIAGTSLQEIEEQVYDLVCVGIIGLDEESCVPQ